MVHKERVKVRLQEAVHPTHPSTRLKVRLPRSNEKGMAPVGNFRFMSLRSSVGPARTLVSTCLADLEKTPQSFSRLLGKQPRRFPRSSLRGLAGQTGKQVRAGGSI